MTDDLFIVKGAVFSPCKKYRYRLWRRWNNEPHVTFVLLNCSTATAELNDPTITRCERRARFMGYGGLEVVNIFAYRATDPREMLAQEDPIGEGNDKHILEACKDAGIVIAGWGAHGIHMNRAESVIGMLQTHGIKLYCLGKTSMGQPRHPLYVSYNVEPEELIWA